MTNAVAELKANVSVPFEEAHAMPPSVYTSQDFLQRELKDIFSKDWFLRGSRFIFRKARRLFNAQFSRSAYCRSSR